jgi:hypothetical protein
MEKVSVKERNPTVSGKMVETRDHQGQHGFKPKNQVQTKGKGNGKGYRGKGKGKGKQRYGDKTNDNKEPSDNKEKKSLTNNSQQVHLEQSHYLGDDETTIFSRKMSQDLLHRINKIMKMRINHQNGSWGTNNKARMKIRRTNTMNSLHVYPQHSSTSSRQ